MRSLFFSTVPSADSSRKHVCADFVKTYFLIISVALSFDEGIYELNICIVLLLIFSSLKSHLFAQPTMKQPTDWVDVRRAALGDRVNSQFYTISKTIDNTTRTCKIVVQHAALVPGANWSATRTVNEEQETNVILISNRNANYCRYCGCWCRRYYEM